MALLQQTTGHVQDVERNSIISSTLRARAPERVYASFGIGALCGHCRRSINPGEVQYELQRDEDAQVRSVKLHRACWLSLRGYPVDP